MMSRRSPCRFSSLSFFFFFIFMRLSIFLTVVFFLSSSSAAPGVTDTLSPGQNLTDGDTLISAGRAFVLGFFSPVNSSSRYVGIWFLNVTAQTFVWVANRQNPIAGNSSVALTVSAAGSLLITHSNSTVLWSSAASSASAAAGDGSFVAQLLDSGNFVVRQEDSNISDEYLWQSFDHPTDTLLPGMKFGPDLRAGLSRSLTSWASPSDPSQGNYTLAIDPRGAPQLVIKSGSVWVWRGGPWNGVGFVGAAPETSYDATTYTSIFHAGSDEIYYSFGTVHGVVTRVVIGHDGLDRRLIWFDPPGSWSVLWSGPTDACDRLAYCGPYGLCDMSKAPSICTCLPGFAPKQAADWGRGDFSGGCERAAPLRCSAGGGGGAGSEDDGFVVVNQAKLPDTTAATIDAGMDLGGCRVSCLKNCSCMAYASANVTAGGSGCIIWTSELTDLRVFANGGQDLYVRQAAVVDGKKNKSWIFGIVGAVVALLIIISLVCFMKNREGRRTRSSPYETALFRCSDELTGKLEVGNEPNSDFFLFQFTQIVEASNNFSFENKLGEGGFGPVYKGKLSGGQEIAIKRLSARSGQGLEEFKNEILLIAKLQHRNLVRLVGCCIEGDEKMLVYEYMHNKSLDLFLFDHNRGVQLDWRRRFHIIEGIAQGLLYLHKHSRLTIIHRDLKASNILLDADMNPKISDFGMARIFSSSETEANTTFKVVGTYGYISPEYALKGHFSTKSDVYSFGVIMLEIITGKRNSGFHHQETALNLLEYTWILWKEGNWLELVDGSLGSNYSLDEVSRCVHVALLCVQERAVDRPSMSDVITMLNSDNASLCYPNQPAFFMVEMADKAHGLQSLNDMTMTNVDGR